MRILRRFRWTITLVLVTLPLMVWLLWSIAHVDDGCRAKGGVRVRTTWSWICLDKRRVIP